MARATRIDWTPDLELKVASKAKELIDSFEESNWAKALYRAQSLVISNRDLHRSQTAFLGSTGSKLKKIAEAGVPAEKKNSSKSKPKPTIPQHPNPDEVQTPAIEAMLDGIATDVAARFEKILFSKIGEVVERTSISFENILLDRLIGASATATALAVDEVEKVFERLGSNYHKQKRPRVLVVGVRGDQASSLLEKFGNHLQLRFHYSGSSPLRSKGLGHYDHVIIWTEFADHSTQSTLRDHHNLHFVSGRSPTHVSDELQKIITISTKH